MGRRLLIIAFILAGAIASAQIQPNARFSFPDRGALAVTTGGAGPLLTGSIRVNTDASAARPSALAILSSRTDAALVNESVVPASPAIQNGRVFINASGPLNTGLAFANPNGQAATVLFYMSDRNGASSGSGSLTIPPGGEKAVFVTE